MIYSGKLSSGSGSDGTVLTNHGEGWMPLDQSEHWKPIIDDWNPMSDDSMIIITDSVGPWRGHGWDHGHLGHTRCGDQCVDRDTVHTGDKGCGLRWLRRCEGARAFPAFLDIRLLPALELIWNVIVIRHTPAVLNWYSDTQCPCLTL